MDFQIDPAELHQFPDRLFRRELQHPANLRELIEDLAEQRGIEQGIEQGELAASRRLLCRLLESQFGLVTDELRQQIHQVEDLDRLEQAIVDCPSLDSLDELEL